MVFENENKLLMSWGVLIFVGFNVNHFIFLTERTTPFLFWTLIVALSFLLTFLFPPRKKERSKKQNQKEMLVYGLFSVLGILVTAINFLNYFSFTLFELGLIWLLVIGLATIVTVFWEKHTQDLWAGFSIVAISLVLLLVPTLYEYRFLIFAIGFGMPLIIAGYKNTY